MDKIKSFLSNKDDSSDSPSHSSSKYDSSSSTARDTARDTATDMSSSNTTSERTPLSTAKAGKTTYETEDHQMAPAVQHETVTRTEEERVQSVIDKERHEDHYRTVVQPLTDRQVDPTLHKQQTAATQHREYEDGNAAETEAALAAERAKFQDTKQVLGTEKTMTNLGTVEKEHVHKHLHDFVQPVIEKETIQPTVVHTTVPIHETHHTSQIHASTVAPTMTLDEFNKTKEGASVLKRDE